MAVAFTFTLRLHRDSAPLPQESKWHSAGATPAPIETGGPGPTMDRFRLGPDYDSNLFGLAMHLDRCTLPALSWPWA